MVSREAIFFVKSWSSVSFNYNRLADGWPLTIFVNSFLEIRNNICLNSLIFEFLVLTLTTDMSTRGFGFYLLVLIVSFGALTRKSGHKPLKHECCVILNKIWKLSKTNHDNVKLGHKNVDVVENNYTTAQWKETSLFIGGLHGSASLLQIPECFVKMLCYSGFSSLLGTNKQLFKQSGLLSKWRYHVNRLLLYRVSWVTHERKT